MEKADGLVYQIDYFNPTTHTFCIGDDFDELSVKEFCKEFLLYSPNTGLVDRLYKLV